MRLCNYLLALGVTTLVGCAVVEPEKPINYYVLDTRPSVIADKPAAVPLKLQGILLPDYLNQPNLVLRDESQRIHVAYYHSWGDSLRGAIERVLSRELNALNRDYALTKQCRSCLSLSVDISHFYPTTQGEVVLSGEYSFSQGDGVVQRHQFLIEQTLEQDGYQHAVAKMSRALEQLAVEINGQLETLAQR
ncbi:MAG: PqiC family protein [Pseudomonadales bacterium]